jgi:hypothetical protein
VLNFQISKFLDAIQRTEITMNSEAMEHEELGQAEPTTPNRTGNNGVDPWTSAPFTGSPSTTFAIATPTGTTTAITNQDGNRHAARGSPINPGSGSGVLASVPSTDEFITSYDRRVLITDLLLVGFIPDDISHNDFSDTMDRIQRHLKVPRINNYYQDGAFAAKFSANGASSWADDGFSYPEERHNSFLLRLGGQLPFSYAGHPSEEQRPMAFSVAASPVQDARPNRWLVVQPVPTNFIEQFLRPPMAVWRGIGLDASLGNASAASLLVSLYVEHAISAWKAEDANCNWQAYSFLSAHKVDIKPPAKPPRTAPEPRRQDRTRDRYNRPQLSSSGRRDGATPPPIDDLNGPTQAQYGELFVVTVSTAPIGMLAQCFESLIPSQAAFGLPLYPIRLCGWWVELSKSTDILRTNERKIPPGPELLHPRSALRIKGLKLGATLGKIIEALGTEGQIANGILCGYIHRSAAGDTCTLITDGPRLLGTMALRPLASSLTPVEEDDVEDMRKLRDRYGTFRRSLGLSGAPDARPPISTAPPQIASTHSESALTVRSARPGPAPTFSDVVRTLPSGLGDQLRNWVTEAIQQEVTTVARQALARVDELEAAHRHQEAIIKQQAVTIAGMDAKQEEHGNTLLLLEANQDSLRDDIDTTQTTLAATAQTVTEHARDWTDLRTFLTQQQASQAQQQTNQVQLSAQLARIEASLAAQAVPVPAARRRPRSGPDPEGPATPPSPGTHSQH